MADVNNPHFSKIYWYIILTTVISFVYLWLVTFRMVPEKNQHTVDFAVGFLLGTVISSGVGYLLGGNPVGGSSKKSDGSASAEISATISTETKKEE